MRTFALAVALLAPVALAAQRVEPVRYDVSFPNAVHHEAEITVQFSGVRSGTLALRMSRSSPGRYALHEFAKNVYGVRVEDGAGQSLAVTHPSPHQWDVATPGGTVRVRYTLFGDRVDGTYAGISLAHAHLNMPATFMWARGYETRPMEVTFHPLAGWRRVATQLAPTADSLRFTAPHLQYFMDSPTMLGPLVVRSWTVTSAGRAAEFRVALDHAGTDAEADAYADGVRRIVRETEGVWGELPAFDFGRYTFLAAYLPWASGDGMEHRNSTSLTSSGALKSRATTMLGTVAHEFFHAWNVERLRPKSLEPFDFSDANPSSELWLAEGFTSYYGELIMTRAGLVPAPAFIASAGANADAVANAPGRRWFSPAEMSQQAPFVDAAVSIDPQNKANTFISYYSWGDAIALGLDLSLRARNDTLSLDTFMRALWNEFGRAQANYAPAKPYRLEDARRVLGRVASDTAWANAFFARYVTGREVPDYAALAARAGIVVRPAHAAAAWLGDTRLAPNGARLAVASPLLQGTPLYAAGVELGDQIAQLDGAPITRAAQVDSIVAAHRPGDRLPIVFFSRDGSRQAVLTLAENPHLEFVLGEAIGQQPTPAQLAFRQRWLGSARKD
ncbi:MAG: M61 family metallopeptidase [Gemmatimonadetes bacterium]|nr:M61 family metallopeptidase [Gemmatimonadota bacterium]